MKTSFLIVAYKDYASLENLLSRIESIPDAEILVWDNTPQEDRQAIKERPNMTVYDGRGVGFAVGCNRLAAQAHGENLVFLNPDTEPEGNWLDKLEIGFDHGYDAITVTSDYIAGIQKREFWADCVEPFAPTLLIIPIVMLIKAETFKELGGFDESFFLGCEDLDFSWRMQRAGKKMAIATDVFVHHIGHTGISQTPDREQIQKNVEARMREKLLDFYGPDVPSSEEIWGCKILATRLKPMRLSVCMIAKSDEGLKELLPGLWFADEIVLVDTKMDRPYRFDADAATRYCKDLVPGVEIKVSHFDWIDDFATARNNALSKCTGDWVLWLDTDDLVSRETGERIKALIKKPGNNTALQVCHFAFKVENTGANGKVTDAFHQSRLFPRLPGIEWGGIGGCKGYVHESYFESCQRLGLQMVTTDLTIQHTGYSDPETVAKKQDRNLRLLEKEPDNCFKFYNIGTSFMAMGEYEKAADAFWRAAELGECESIAFRDNCRYTLALALMRLGKYSGAAPLLENNTKADSKYLLGECLIALGRIEEGCDSLWAYLKMGEVTDYLGSNWPIFRKQAVKTLTEIGVLAT